MRILKFDHVSGVWLGAFAGKNLWNVNVLERLLLLVGVVFLGLPSVSRHSEGRGGVHLHVHCTLSLSFFGVQGACSAFYARDMNPAEHEQALHVGSAKRIPAMPIVASHHADEIAPGIHNQMCICLPHVAISDVSRLPTCPGHSSMLGFR